MEWLLELALVVLLAATLFHAMRLERALGVLKRDRAALEELVVTFNGSTRAAEQGIERLHAAAEGAGRQMQRQVEVAAGLKDDLLFLIERGERVADRLDLLVRAGRPLAQEPAHEAPPRAAADLSPGERLQAELLQASRVQAERAQAERLQSERMQSERLQSERLQSERMHAERMQSERLQSERMHAERMHAERLPGERAPAERLPPETQDPSGPRLRSQAERDLLRALRAAR